MRLIPNQVESRGLSSRPLLNFDSANHDPGGKETHHKEQVPLIGFQGRGVVRAIVPKIAPGDYRPSKRFVLRGGSTTTSAHAQFVVKE
jgi:hypothetical protein